MLMHQEFTHGKGLCRYVGPTHVIECHSHTNIVLHCCSACSEATRTACFIGCIIVCSEIICSHRHPDQIVLDHSTTERSRVFVCSRLRDGTFGSSNSSRLIIDDCLSKSIPSISVTTMSLRSTKPRIASSSLNVAVLGMYNRQPRF
jgi:hypothetical protein